MNGELLLLMEKEKIEIFITNDKNLRYQQKLNQLSLIIIELNTKGNQYDLTAPIIKQINKYLLSNKFRQRLKKRKKIFYIIWGED